jgi:hypothetical protein
LVQAVQHRAQPYCGRFNQIISGFPRVRVERSVPCGPVLQESVAGQACLYVDGGAHQAVAAASAETLTHHVRDDLIAHCVMLSNWRGAARAHTLKVPPTPCLL